MTAKKLYFLSDIFVYRRKCTKLEIESFVNPLKSRFLVYHFRTYFIDRSM